MDTNAVSKRLALATPNGQPRAVLLSSTGFDGAAGTAGAEAVTLLVGTAAAAGTDADLSLAYKLRPRREISCAA